MQSGTDMMIRWHLTTLGLKDIWAKFLEETFEQALKDRLKMPKNSGELWEEVHFRYFETSIPKA